jgi:hypothetical protein
MGIQSISENFPKPKFPWLSLRSPFSIDGAPVLGGLEYRVCYWIEHGVHHLEIPQTSHNSIRKVGFLGDDDELVIMAPVQGCLIRWDSIEDRPTAVIEAAVWWRARLDGTHG